MDLFVSSNLKNKKNLYDCIYELSTNNIKNIELTSGKPYERYIKDKLIEIKKKFKINFNFHNYFPVPKDSFVLNLSSLNDQIYEKSLNFCFETIELANKLNINKYAVHAGYYIDFHESEAGLKKSKTNLYDKEKSKIRFCNAIENLNKINKGPTRLYIENNVYSLADYEVYGKNKPYMLLDVKDFIELKQKLKFNLLLDVAHLFVTSNSLKLNFNHELEYLIKQTDYLHYSENNRFVDSNNGTNKFDTIFKSIKKYNLSNKSITLEIYDSIESIMYSYNKFSSLPQKNI